MLSLEFFSEVNQQFLFLDQVTLYLGFLLKGFKACKARTRKLSPHDDLGLQKSKKQMHAFFASLNETLRKMDYVGR